MTPVGPYWNPIAAEYSDTLQTQRTRQNRPCAGGCGKNTTAFTGYCMDCQPELLDEPAQEPRATQLGPDDPWPEGF